MYDYNYNYNYGYGYGYQEPSSSMLGGLAAIAGVYMIVMLALCVLMLVSMYKIFKKAGKKGWEAIIPVYNIIVLLQIVELPLWYIALFFVPFANIYAIFKIYIELAHKFGKSTGFGVLSVFFSVITLPILAFSKTAVYQGNGGTTTPNNFDPNTGAPVGGGAVVSFDSNPVPPQPMMNETPAPMMNEAPVNPMPMGEPMMGPAPASGPVNPAPAPMAAPVMPEPTVAPMDAPVTPVAPVAPTPMTAPVTPVQPVGPAPVAPEPIPVNNVFGSPAPSKFCPNCGTQVDASITSCPKCGSNL